MYPHDMEREYLYLPPSEDRTIVLVTGKELRHRRFALRIIESFGERVKGWYELDDSLRSPHKGRAISSKLSRLEKIPSFAIDMAKYCRHRGLKAAVRKSVTDISNLLYRIRLRSRSLRREEEKLFAKEVARLEKKIDMQARKIETEYVHTDDFREEIRQLDPYLFLTLGGPLYKSALIESIRGVAINQHAGSSPRFKGSNTIHWALYHRKLEDIASTVHLTVSAADSGAILRRSTVTLHPDDSIESIFLRTVALGTELMIEVVEEIIDPNSQKIAIFPQDSKDGRSYLDSELNFPVRKALLRDFDSGWLREELERIRRF